MRFTWSEPPLAHSLTLCVALQSQAVLVWTRKHLTPQAKPFRNARPWSKPTLMRPRGLWLSTPNSHLGCSPHVPTSLLQARGYASPYLTL